MHRDMHFLKADSMWNAIERLKRWVVESFFHKKITAVCVYCIKTLTIFRICFANFQKKIIFIFSFIFSNLQFWVYYTQNDFQQTIFFIETDWNRSNNFEIGRAYYAKLLSILGFGWKKKGPFCSSDLSCSQQQQVESRTVGKAWNWIGFPFRLFSTAAA